MNLLDANDQPGHYPPSWYAHSVQALDCFAPLDGDTSCEVCVIGAGFSGLSAALELAEQGVDVVLIESHRVGWGASGRNGGQLGSGMRLDQATLESMLGRDKAHALWQLAERGKDIIHNRCATYGIDCDYKPGLLHVDHRRRYSKSTQQTVQHLQDEYDYTAIRFVEQDECRSMVGSEDYYGASLDMGAGHLHPLKLALGMAQACHDKGVRIYEQTRVATVEPGVTAKVKTSSGLIQADRIILACNGYLGSLNNTVASRVMPINNFIIATEPLDNDLATSLIRDDVAVADSRFVVNYFRLSHDKRLLFGGRESYGYRFPADIKAFVRKAMLGVYPKLGDTRIDFGWGGTLAITRNRMPHFHQIDESIVSIGGYSGHGVVMANLAGVLAAQATQGQREAFDLMADVPSPRFPGGQWLRWPLLVIGMSYYSARDRI